MTAAQAPIPPIGDQLTRLAESAPHEIAVSCGSETITRGEAGSDREQVGTRLRRPGCRCR